MNIRRKLRRVLALAALTSCVCAGSLGETLRIYPGPYEWNDGVQVFRQRHPDLTLEGVPVDEQDLWESSLRENIAMTCLRSVPSRLITGPSWKKAIVWI